MRILSRIFANAIALLATTIVPGISFNGSFWSLLLAGAIMGLFNLIVRPVVMLLSLPFLILTLGLFYFVLNGLLLWAASYILPGYRVDGFLPGLLGSLVFAIVNGLLSSLVKGEGERT